MRSSCIDHPKKEPLILVHQWQIKACDGNRCAAMLLSFFEYWHNNKIDSSAKAARQNEIAIAHGDKPTQDQSLLQFHNEKELENGILGFYGTTSIRTAVDLLKKKGFISVHKNPNDRYKFDQTRYFLFHDDEVNKWLESAYPKQSSEITDRTSKTTNGQLKITSGQSEITNDSLDLTIDLYTETSSEITPESSPPPTPRSEREGVNQEKDFKTEESDQNLPVPCQKSTEAVARMEDVHETRSSAAPQKTQPEEKPQPSSISDPMGDRFRAKGHPYPDLLNEGLGHLWVGPKRYEFLPELEEAAIAHLKKYDRPHMLGEARNYIKNLIRDKDWTALELRESEAKKIAERMQGTDSPQSSQPAQFHNPKYRPLTEEEDAAIRAEQKRREEEMRVAAQRSKQLMPEWLRLRIEQRQKNAS